MGHRCPTCEKELTTERGMRQHHTKVHDESLPNRTCKRCGTEFYDEKARLAFCDDCNPEAGEHNGNWKDAKETTTCERCEAAFEFYPSDKEGSTAPTCVDEMNTFVGTPSYELRDVERLERECDYCGTEFTVLECDAVYGEDDSVATSVRTTGCQRIGGERTTPRGAVETLELRMSAIGTLCAGKH
jgi:predicted nucleic-acid-binding Zn-ribbon protein